MQGHGGRPRRHYSGAREPVWLVGGWRHAAYACHPAVRIRKSLREAHSFDDVWRHGVGSGG